MKTTTLLSLFLLVLSADSAHEPVLDVYEKNIRTGIDYYIMPAAKDGRRGGLLPATTTTAIGPNDTFPNGIAQLQTNSRGLPLTFSPVNPKKDVIWLSTDVIIKFSGPTGCQQSNAWKLKYDMASRQHLIMVGGIEVNPGCKTLDNWFKIEITKYGYKLVFCPNVCNLCKVLCRDVGIYIDDKGIRQLALSNVP